MKSNFDFLLPEWPDVHEAAARAEELAQSDARTACFQARRALELAVHWLYKFEAKGVPPVVALADGRGKGGLGRTGAGAAS